MLDKSEEKIAVAGDSASFSELAAKEYSKKINLQLEIIYATDSKGVFDLITKKSAKLGIIPILNSAGGLVEMSWKELEKQEFRAIDMININVEQCLIVKEGIVKESIKKIVSHSQALRQCSKYLSENFSNLNLEEWEDTAKAVCDLKNGVLEKSVGVIASKQAAEKYGLKVLEYSVQNLKPNMTTFLIITK